MKKTSEQIRREVLKEVEDERYRQLIEEGWSSKHDDGHDAGDLACAGASYALNAGCQLSPYMQQGLDEPPAMWPQEWNQKWWKPKSPRRDLVRAAALLIAEIERIDRGNQRDLKKRLATCIGCGCDDDHACQDGCWWLRVDYTEGKGVCSQCDQHLEAWDRGDHTSHAQPVSELENPARIHRPEQKRSEGDEPCKHDWPFADVQMKDKCRWCGMSFTRHVFTECP